MNSPLRIAERKRQKCGPSQGTDRGHLALESCRPVDVGDRAGRLCPGPRRGISV